MKHLAAGPLDLRGQQTRRGCLTGLPAGAPWSNSGAALGARTLADRSRRGDDSCTYRPASVRHVVAYSLLRQAPGQEGTTFRQLRPGPQVSYLAGRAEFQSCTVGKPSAISRLGQRSATRKPARTIRARREHPPCACARARTLRDATSRESRRQGESRRRRRPGSTKRGSTSIDFRVEGRAAGGAVGRTVRSGALRLRAATVRVVDHEQRHGQQAPAPGAVAPAHCLCALHRDIVAPASTRRCVDPVRGCEAARRAVDVHDLILPGQAIAPTDQVFHVGVRALSGCVLHTPAATGLADEIGPEPLR